MGRFLLAADQQEEDQKSAIEQKHEPKSRRPSVAETELARNELDFIFSGPNTNFADALYRRGMDDVVNGRKPRADTIERNGQLREFTDSLALMIFGADTAAHSVQYTPEALFYIYVEKITEVATYAYDVPGE